MNILDELQNNIGYHFSNLDLLERALTHRSVGKDNYERMEFLGDSILNCLVSMILFHQKSDSQEGALSITRSRLVNKRLLSKIGQSWSIDPYIKKSGQQKISQAIRADVVEAVIAGIYLDSSLKICYGFAQNLFLPYLEALGTKDLKDYKSRLQEWAHRKKYALPKYAIEKTSGKAP